ncbi:MAG: FAD-binding protein, partial [Coriobacteriia bacterium]|nr:FAD-binding protein [Coriobacteriia bacterium]
VEKSIAEWNEFCAAGFDPQFGLSPEHLKPINSPPFYGIRNHPQIIALSGGLEVNDHYQALDVDNNPITGLYAAGTGCGGSLVGSLDWQMHTSVSIGNCQTSGRYAAIHAITGGHTPSNPGKWDEVKHLYSHLPADKTFWDDDEDEDES